MKIRFVPGLGIFHMKVDEKEIVVSRDDVRGHQEEAAWTRIMDEACRFPWSWVTIKTTEGAISA